MGKKQSKTFTLDSESIDEISTLTHSFFNEKYADENMSQRVCLCMEEALIVVYEELGEDVEVEVSFSKRIGKPCVSIKYKGANFNPLNSDKIDRISEVMLSGLGVRPAHSYHFGVNKLAFTIPTSGIRQELLFLGAIGLALIIGICGSFIPETVKKDIIDFLLDPISDTFMKMLNLVAPLLIFLCVLTSIISNENGDAFGKSGKYIIGRFVITTLIISVISAVIISFFFSFNYSGTSELEGEFKGLLDMFLGIIPGNAVAPFLEANMMQIVLISIMLGVIIVRLDTRVDRLRGIMLDLRDVFYAAMELICKVLPIFIFTSLLQMFWENGTEIFITLWKPIVILLGIGIVYISIGYIIISIKLKVSFFRLVKKVFPSFIVAFSTASSIATMGKASEVRKTLGLSSDFFNISYPLGINLYEGFYIPLYFIMIYYFADYYALPISPIWFVSAFIVSVIVCYSTPKVSGGGLVCITVMMAQLGIPESALAIASIMNMILDFFGTGFKITGIHQEMILQAHHLKCIDEEVLRNE